VQVWHGSASFGGVVEELLVDAGSAGLLVLAGVVSLPGEHVDACLVGGEVGAGLADRFVVAVHVGGSLTPSVTEHPLVLLTEPPHVRAFGAGGWVL
jgi:hypothetical protein